MLVLAFRRCWKLLEFTKAFPFCVEPNLVSLLCFKIVSPFHAPCTLSKFCVCRNRTPRDDIQKLTLEHHLINEYPHGVPVSPPQHISENWNRIEHYNYSSSNCVQFMSKFSISFLLKTQTGFQVFLYKTNQMDLISASLFRLELWGPQRLKVWGWQVWALEAHANSANFVYAAPVVVLMSLPHRCNV